MSATVPSIEDPRNLDDDELERLRVWVVERAGDRPDGGWPRAYADLAVALGVDALLAVLGLVRDFDGDCSRPAT